MLSKNTKLLEALNGLSSFFDGTRAYLLKISG